MSLEPRLLTYDEVVARAQSIPITNRPAAESALKTYLRNIGCDLLPIKWWTGEPLVADSIVLANFEADAWQAAAASGAASAAANALTVGRGLGLQRTWTPMDETVLRFLQRQMSAATLVMVGKSAAEAVAWGSVLRTVEAQGGQLRNPLTNYCAMMQTLLDAYCNGLWAYQIGVSDVKCIMRPTVRVEDGRLHSAKSPALVFENTNYFFWRGVNVQQNWIEHPANLDPKVALTERNVELRRVATEIIGWKRIIEQLDAKVIDHDPNPMIGDLLQVDLPFARDSLFLRARCGTGRTVVLRVPRRFNEVTIDSAAKANAWTQGITIEQLKKMEVRT